MKIVNFIVFLHSKLLLDAIYHRKTNEFMTNFRTIFYTMVDVLKYFMLGFFLQWLTIGALVRDVCCCSGVMRIKQLGLLLRRSIEIENLTVWIINKNPFIYIYSMTCLTFTNTSPKEIKKTKYAQGKLTNYGINNKPKEQQRK